MRQKSNFTLEKKTRIRAWGTTNESKKKKYRKANIPRKLACKNFRGGCEPFRMTKKRKELLSNEGKDI